jgi:hypothetical protein
MALKVIGAGVGRTATFSLKFALEHIGFGPCYHMSEVQAGARRNIPLWMAAIAGKPDWDAIFDGFASTCDYPACTYWRELASYYPDAKVILTTRDPNAWFDSVTSTIFSRNIREAVAGTPVGAFMDATIFNAFGPRIEDRAFMTDWFVRRNREVAETIPPKRLLEFSPKDGWQPLCDFLGVNVPDAPFPRVNSRDELEAAMGDVIVPDSPEAAEEGARAYIELLRAKAFAGS